MSAAITDLTTVMSPDPDLVSLLRDVFDAYESRRHVATAEIDLDHDLWRQLDALGLARFTTAEDHGGSGGGLTDAAALWSRAAAVAAPVPLVEHDLLASWLLVAAGLPTTDTGLCTATIVGANGSARAVPWARYAESVVALWQEPGTRGAWRVANVPANQLTVEPRRDVAGRPSDNIQVPIDALRAGARVDPGVREQWRLRGALARCAQAVGAMEAVQTLVLAHVCERTQFGRPIGKYQAVQHLVADIAAESALARAATDAAVLLATRNGWEEPGLPFAIAVAKSTVGHASSVVVRGSHQALGAIGTTLEHSLHLLTQPILAWRGDFGSVHEWDTELTRMAVAAGGAGLWPLLTGDGEKKTSPHQ